MRAEWLRVTGNAKYVHLTPIYALSKSGKKLYNKVNKKAIRELVKYTTKCADFSKSPERVDEFLTAFKNHRRVQGFGSFQGVEKEEREPGCDDDAVIPGCACGKCAASSWKWEAGIVHISETRLMPDGTRQLAFDYVSEMAGSIEESPPGFSLERQAVERDYQERLEFSGAMPEVLESLPQLFAA